MKLNINKARIGAAIINAEMKGLRALADARNAYLLAIGVLIGASIVVSGCAGGFIDATSIPQLDTNVPDPTPIIPDPTATADTGIVYPHVVVEPSCNIIDYDPQNYGAYDAFGNYYPAALPEGHQILLNCKGDHELWNIGYADYDVSFLMGPEGPIDPNIGELNELERLGQMHPLIYDVPPDPLFADCNLNKYDVDLPGGYILDGVDMSGDDFAVAAVTGSSDSTTIFVEGHNTPQPSLNLRFPEFVRGAPEALHRLGQFTWVALQKLAGRIFKVRGYFDPSSNCPLFTRK